MITKERQLILHLVIYLIMRKAAYTQQTINSRGDNNTNVNGNLIQPVISVGDKKIVKKTVINNFGSDREWEGVLLPGKANRPSGPCETPIAQSILNGGGKEPQISLRVFAGTNEMVCHQLPCNLVRTDSDEMLWVGGKPGLLKIEARIKDRDGNIIVSLERGKYYVNRNRTYRPPVRDRSSLKVFDERGSVVLGVSFVNAGTLVLETGRFFDEQGRQLLISPSLVEMSQEKPVSHIELSATCLGDYQGLTMTTGAFIFGGIVGKE